MFVKVSCSVWLATAVTLVIMDVRSLALLQKESLPLRCYVCDPASSSNVTLDCNTETEISTASCLGDKPFCATVTSAPNFTQSLVCSKGIARPCSLRFSVRRQSFVMSCVCRTDLCNRPFAANLHHQLNNFTSSISNQINTSMDFTETFFKTFNLTEATIFKTVMPRVVAAPQQPIAFPDTKTDKQSIRVKNIPEIETNAINDAPRVEALKQETTPSDDDEDEGEGSGVYEESRGQRRSGAVPAAPSSFLPAEENKASFLTLNVFLYTPFLLYVIV